MAGLLVAPDPWLPFRMRLIIPRREAVPPTHGAAIRREALALVRGENEPPRIRETHCK